MYFMTPSTNYSFYDTKNRKMCFKKRVNDNLFRGTYFPEGLTGDFDFSYPVSRKAYGVLAKYAKTRREINDEICILEFQRFENDEELINFFELEKEGIASYYDYTIVTDSVMKLIKQNKLTGFKFYESEHFIETLRR